MTEKSRREIHDRILDAMDMLRQAELCFFNGQRQDPVNEKQLLAWIDAVREILRKKDIKRLLKS